MILLVIFLFPLKSPSFSIVETSGSIWNTAVLDVNPVVLNDSTPSTTVKLLFLADPRLTVGKCAPVLSWVYLDDTIAARQYKLATDGSQQLLQTININVQNLSQGKHTIRSVSFIAGWGASKFQQTAFQCEAPLLDLISTLESMNNVTPEHFTSSEILSYGFFVVQEQNIFKDVKVSEDQADFEKISSKGASH